MADFLVRSVVAAAPVGMEEVAGGGRGNMTAAAPASAAAEQREVRILSSMHAFPILQKDVACAECKKRPPKNMPCPFFLSFLGGGIVAVFFAPIRKGFDEKILAHCAFSLFPPLGVWHFRQLSPKKGFSDLVTWLFLRG